MSNWRPMETAPKDGRWIRIMWAFSKTEVSWICPRCDTRSVRWNGRFWVGHLGRPIDYIPEWWDDIDDIDALRKAGE